MPYPSCESSLHNEAVSHTQACSLCLEGACSAAGGWERGTAHPQDRTEEDDIFKTPHKVPREFLERVSFHLVGKDTGGAIRGSGMVQMVGRLEGHGYTEARDGGKGSYQRISVPKRMGARVLGPRPGGRSWLKQSQTV